MKVYKLTVMIIDHDDVDDVAAELEAGRFGNRCIDPQVYSVESQELPDEWDDNNPINMIDGWKAEFEKLFPTLTRKDST